MISKVMAFILLVCISPVFFMVAILIYFVDGTPIFFIQQRIGQNNTEFKMYKFRTMIKNTPNVATHLLDNPHHFLIPLGGVIRMLSLDELPNLINIIKGDMVFIGPRPALFNQYDLIEARTAKGIHLLKPGLTGWAQVNGRDDLTDSEKVSFDLFYKNNRSFSLNMKIIIFTFIKSLKGSGVNH